MAGWPADSIKWAGWPAGGCWDRESACSDAARKDKRTERQVPTGQEGGTSPKSVVLEPAPLQLRVASPAPAARRATPSDPPHAQGGPAAVAAAAATALVAAVAAVATATATATAPYPSAECPPLVCPSTCLSMSNTGSLAAARQTHPPAWKPSPPARSRLLPAATLHANILGRPGESRPHVETGARAGLCSNRPGHHQHWARFRPNPMAMGSDLTRPHHRYDTAQHAQ
jgi:hypothetical protein